MYPFVKRLLDVLAAATLLILLTLPFLVVSIWIKLDSRGPVVFRQKRAGRNLKSFTVYKFRSMSIHAPKNAPTNSLKNAHSFITSSGKIMRKLSIDELPQLVNVLKGEMSLVGPRPVVLNETSLLDERAKYGANDVTPGITGWAQANGRDELDDVEKARMDGEYVDKFGFLMDLKCLAYTFAAVLALKGHKEGHESGLDGSSMMNANVIDANLMTDEGWS